MGKPPDTQTDRQPANFPPQTVIDFQRDMDVIYEAVRETYLKPLDEVIAGANRITALGFPNFLRLFQHDDGASELILDECDVRRFIDKAAANRRPKDTEDSVKAKGLVQYFFVLADEVQARESMNLWTEIAWSWLFMRWQLMPSTPAKFRWKPPYPLDVKDIQRHIAEAFVLSEGKEFHGIYAMKELWDKLPARKAGREAGDVAESVKADALKYRALTAGKEAREYKTHASGEEIEAKQNAWAEKLSVVFPDDHDNDNRRCPLADAPEFTMAIKFRSQSRRMPKPEQEYLLDCLERYYRT